MNFLAQAAQASSDVKVNWVEVAGAIWTVVSAVVIPLLMRRSSKFKKIALLLIQGVEDSPETIKAVAEKANVDPRIAEAATQALKDSIKKAAEEEGVEKHLAPLVEKVTEEKSDAPPK